MTGEVTREEMIAAVHDSIGDWERRVQHAGGDGYSGRRLTEMRAVLRELEAGGWRIDGQTLAEAARELVRQIANNDFRDSHGHEAVRLRAYAVLQRFVSRPPGTSEGSDK